MQQLLGGHVKTQDHWVPHPVFWFSGSWVGLRIWQLLKITALKQQPFWVWSFFFTWILEFVGAQGNCQYQDSQRTEQYTAWDQTGMMLSVRYFITTKFLSMLRFLSDLWLWTVTFTMSSWSFTSSFYYLLSQLLGKYLFLHSWRSAGSHL